MNKNDKLFFLTIGRITQRAREMGIADGERITQFMDIENAAIQFNMRLEEMADAPDADFAHDFIGIQDNINRETGKVEGLFVPRYAGRKA